MADIRKGRVPESEWNPRKALKDMCRKKKRSVALDRALIHWPRGTGGAPAIWGWNRRGKSPAKVLWDNELCEVVDPGRDQTYRLTAAGEALFREVWGDRMALVEDLKAAAHAQAASEVEDPDG